MSYPLSIIVPAYKVDYIDQAFESIYNQTCKDFNLYVFDDNSPNDIRPHYEKYFLTWKNARYLKFDENIGGRNLVEHWNRCVRSTDEEEWFWLFSDDDVMNPDCVASFYKELEIINRHDIVRFNWDEIDKNNVVVKKKKAYPEKIGSFSFFKSLYFGDLDARMPEFIIRRNKFEQCGGFVNFDLAWRSDNASVMLFGFPNEVYTISQGKILWRRSDANITNGAIDISSSQRKDISTINFFNWIIDFSKKNEIELHLSKHQLIECLVNNLYFSDYRCGIEYLDYLCSRFCLTQDRSSRGIFYYEYIRFEYKHSTIRYVFKRVIFLLWDYIKNKFKR